MPRLPDATAFGQERTPQATRPAIGYDVSALTARGGYVDSAGAGADAFTDVANKIGNDIAQTEMRMRTRADAVARARAYSEFTEKSEAELRRLSTEDDLGSPETVGKFSKFLDDQQATILGTHGGSQESRLMLEERIVGMRSAVAARAAQMTMEAQDKTVLDMIGGKVNTLVSQTWNSPGTLVQQFSALDKEIDDMAPALRPGMERQMRSAGRERIAEAALGSLIGRGGIDQAEKMLATPGLSEILGDRAQSRIQNQIIAARQVLTNAQTKGLAERTFLRTVLGREPSEPELAAHLGLTPKTDQTTVEIGDATSPTGTRIIPRFLVGQNLTPDLLNRYPAGKPPSGLDIKFGPDGKPISITTGRQGSESAVPGLGTTASGEVDKELLAALGSRQSLQAIKTRFKPEFQQIPTRLGFAWNVLKDKGGGMLGEMDPQDKASLDEFTQYRAEAGQMFSNVLKQLSGVAVNPSELKRAESYLPAPGSGVFDGDSPTELDAKIKRFTEFNDKAIARLAYTKARGVKFDTVNLDDMPQIIRKRGDEVAKQLESQGMAGDALKGAVRMQIAREFGFVGP